jgi:triosephosphate isomerase
MYHGGASGCDLASEIARGVGSTAAQGGAAQVVVAPPYTGLAAVAASLQGSRVEVSAQNLHEKSEGAYTGEVSAAMLLDAGCKWVIIGHSERREYFKESDALVAEKTRVAIAAGLQPIACIGEKLEEREAGQTLNVLLEQLKLLAPVLASKVGFGVIAYEPVWAIGTGKVATTEQAQEAHAAIRGQLAKVSPDLAAKTRILYGGSVKPDNAQALLACPDIDGALVGGASLKADSFLKIVGAAPTRH